MSWIKVISINCTVFFCLITLIEISYNIYIKISPRSQCEYTWVLYSYCSDIVTSKINYIEDGGETIKIKTDDIGGRIPLENGSNDKNENEIFLIGDSFIQADEISYNETVYGQLSNIHGIKSYAVGYQSWNVIQYYDVIRKIGLQNKHYLVFLMSNDVAPSYPRSVYRELENRSKNILTEFKKVLSSLFKFSYAVYRKIGHYLESSTNKISLNNQAYISSNQYSEQYINNCHSLDAINQTSYINKLGYDYLVFSKEQKCWPEKHINAYEQFIEVTQEMAEFVKNTLNSKISFIFVANGWSSKYQHTLGRLTNEYRFNEDIEITQKGLTNKLKNDLIDYLLIDSEEVINNEINKCGLDCKDLYYFPIDGHWRPKTHKIIADKISILINKE